MNEEYENALNYCREVLSEVSRSFALTIPMMDEELRDPVTVIYLQDRLLDNFEDELPDLETERRSELMDKVVRIFEPDQKSRPEEIEEIRDWAEEFEDASLQKFTKNVDTLWRAYRSLCPEVRKISFPWLEEMNRGMKKFLTQPVNTFADLDEYCYFVAGTVGGFLTELVLHFAPVEEESEEVLLDNYSQAGKFLQKVNITRDIRKDVQGRNRIFWPLEEIGLSARELLSEEHSSCALEALGSMIESAAEHVPALFDYMQALPEDLPGYKKFYCVNNAMGLATLDLLSGNYDVFTSSSPVKIPRWKTFLISKFPEKYMYKLGKNYAR